MQLRVGPVSARRSPPSEPRPEGPSWGKWALPEAERSPLERPPPAPGRLEEGGGIALTLTSESEDPEEDGSDTLAEWAERAGEGDRPPPCFPPERDLSRPDDCLWRFSGREDS